MTEYERTPETAPQAYRLAQAIPSKYIEQAPRGKYGTYVPHFVIEQILLLTVGPFTTHHVETIYGDVPETKSGDTTHPALSNAVVGVVLSLTVTVDGREVTVTEGGACDAAGYEWNNGERYKKATSDALKRCAMRLGVGLHLWCKRPDQFFLPRIMREGTETVEDAEVVIGGEDVDLPDSSVAVKRRAWEIATGGQPVPEDQISEFQGQALALFEAARAKAKIGDGEPIDDAGAAAMIAHLDAAVERAEA